MALTLLDMVQDILTEMDGDEVNSISDTVEATSIANTIRIVYRDMLTEHDIPAKMDLIALEGLGDVNKPNVMGLPSTVSRINWIKYDNRISVSADKHYVSIEYMKPREFVELVNSRPSTDTTNYQVVTYAANVPLIVAKLVGPSYWTSFNDTQIVFDAYNSSLESTLQASKSLTEATLKTELIISDTTIPDLPENLERQLYTQSLARCFANLKTSINPKAERNESRFRVRHQRNKWRSGRMVNDTPDYGRK